MALSSGPLRVQSRTSQEVVEATPLPAKRHKLYAMAAKNFFQ